MTSLESWLAYIEKLHPENIELGLERVARVHARLPSAASTAKVLTVAGTNGKGSTVECLMQCLLTQRVSVAAYTSPHLREFNERIRINGCKATDEAIVAAFGTVEAQRNDIELTYFEFATLVAFEVFHTHKVDVWILEVGMGGRLDAVNIVDADIAIITAIGIDHSAWLGDTREEIAREKAGIMRRDTPVICTDPEPPAAISEYACSAGSKLIQLGTDFHYSTGGKHWLWEGQREARAGLTIPGHAHLDNFAGALAALEVLERLPDVTTLNRVFESWEFSGRLQVVPGDVEWWLDVAHNKESVETLAMALTRHPQNGTCICVIGLLADKPVAAMLSTLVPCVAEWIVVALDSSRALPATAIAEELRRQGVRKVTLMHSVAAGCAVARARSQTGDRIVVTGSFHTAGPAMGWLGL